MHVPRPPFAGGIAQQLQEAPPKPGEIAARDPPCP